MDEAIEDPRRLEGRTVTMATSSTSHTIDAVIDLLGGSAGGAACVAVGQPLDTVKVKMQTFPELYRNGLNCFGETFKKEGVKGLYAGTVPSLVANVAENSVLFAAYGMCQKVVQFAVGKNSVQELTALHNATAGFLGAFFSSLTLCPTELVKCRLQAMREVCARVGEARPNIGPWNLTRDILRMEGVPGLYRGLSSTFVREMPGYFFFFGGYEFTRNLLTPEGKTKDDIGLLRTTVAGGVGGTCLWVVIFPADVVKSRIQVAGSTEPMLSVLSTILKKEGFRALYKGLGPTLIRTFPACGALFVTYEWVKKALHLCVDI